MIPTFPNFKKLEYSDREEIERITSKYPPYSDFNFTSMWSWDIKEEMKISSQQGSLIVKFNDYINNEPFYSFLGENNVNNIANQILKLCEREKIKPILKLVPEISIRSLDTEIFLIAEDIDNFDYILSIDKLNKYEGSILATKRNYVRRFIKDRYDYRFEIIDLNNQDLHEDIKEIFSDWILEKDLSDEYTENEFTAINRFLDISKNINLFSSAIWIDNKLVAFWLLENNGNQYVTSHFEKAKTHDYKGIYAFLVQQTSKELLKNGILYINHEQDLGIQGLRINKQSFDPLMHFKKFIVQKR